MQAHEQAQFLQAVGMFIRQQINLAISPLLEKIEILEKQLHAPIDIRTIIEQLPTKEGPPGKPGENGRDGADCDMEAVMARVDKYIENVRPENGKDGNEGKQGPPGRDGADIVSAFRDSDGHLILTLSNGTTKDIGPIHGADGKDGMPGKDGKDGRDGFGFEEFNIEYDGEKTFTFYFVRGEDRKEFKFITPLIIYRGIWRPGKYLKGDAATYEGGMFIAREKTETAPGTIGSDWQLATKRGRDGKEGEKGEAGSDGKPGRDGRDLTQLAFDGTKY